MDVQNSLRRRKSQKRVKTDSAKGTGDVLVVPPDILKKLGIRIDNSNADLQSSNIINIVQTSDIVNNESTATVPTSNVLKKSSESSCLETANLMKKSVFLSPSFVPTLANVSSGEVEISNIDNNDDSKMAAETFPLGSMENKNVNGNISTSDSYLAVCDPISVIHNIKTTMEATSKERSNEDNTVQIDPKITPDDCERELVKLIVHNSNSKNKKKVVETHSDREFSLTDVIQNTSILENSINHIQKTVVDNNLISVSRTEIQLDESNDENFSINTLESTKNIRVCSNDVNVAINPVERIIIESKKYDIEKHFSSLQGTDIEQELIGPELNKYPLEKSGNAKELTEIQNNLFIVEKSVTTNEFDEAENNLIPFGGIQIEITDVESDTMCFREIDLKQSDYELNSTPVIKRGTTEKESKIQHNIFTEEEKVTETELDEAENNHISLEGIQIELADVESNMICLGDNDLKQSESNIVFLENIPMQNELAVDEANVFSTEGNTVQLLMSEKNIYPLENETVSLENCTKDLLLKGSKLKADTGPETNSSSDKTENNIVNSLVNDNEQIPQIHAPGNIFKSKDPEMIQISNNNILCNGSIETKTQYNSNLKDTKQIDLDFNSTERIVDKVAPVNKFIQKISIISEEIIPPSDLKELRNSHSPINFSLTPVPLYSIIAPKRIKEYEAETKVLCKIKPIVLPNKTEVPPSETKAATNSNSHLPQEKTDPIDTGETNNEQSEISFQGNDASKYNSKKTKHKDISYMPLIDKGDLQNNNDILVESSLAIKCNDNLIESSCMIHAPVLNEDLVTENAKNDHNVNNEQNINKNGNKIPSDINFTTVDNFSINKNGDKIPSDINFTTVDNFSKKISNADQESIEIRKESRDQNSLGKKKKKKKAKEDQNIGVTENIVTEDKEFYKNQLEDIVKSTKENSDANAHQDKVKEIADYIKKYAHFYKSNKRQINKNDKKNTMHFKSNMTKSKLCIQGVEKPGGYKNKRESPREINVLRTYTRQKKNKIPCTSKLITANHKMECDIYDATETDLNTVNISMSYNKQQDFCLCYDFGRLDISDYDNSYEHIHFWLHNDNTDLDSILSIYDDEEIIYNDRTKLYDVQIMEDMEINTKTSNICWNYFMRNEKEANPMQSKKNSVISDSDTDIVSSHQTGEKDSLVKNHDLTSKIDGPANITEQYDNVNQIEIVSNDIDRDSSAKELLGIPLISGSDDSYEVITIVEVADNSNIQEDLETTGSFSTQSIFSEDNLLHKDETPENPKKDSKSNTSQIFKSIKKVAADPDDNKQESSCHHQPSGCDRKDETSKQGPSKRKSQQVSKEAASAFGPESSRKDNQKRSLPVENRNPEPSVKKNVKCGVCSKLLSNVDWNRHVAKKHNYIAWKAGQSINLDDPDLLKNLRQKYDTVGSLKCPMCYFQTTKFNRFIGHVKNCLSNKTSSSRRASLSKDIVICGVCGQNVQYLSWNEHIGKAHNYLAWINGQDTLDLEDEAAVSKHLQSIIRGGGSLKCYKCGLNRKRVKLYLQHIETCDGSETPVDDPSTSMEMNSTKHEVAESSVSEENIVTCGVCNEKIPVLEWTEHIGKEHNYLAWEEGSTPLILDDEEEVRNHLQEFIRHSGGLRCYKCGLNRRRVKPYLSHIQTCIGDGVNLDQSALEMSVDQSSPDEKTFECAVCKAKVQVLDWNEHIGREHNYLAWRVGATPLILDDEEEVRNHLQELIRHSGGLRCYKCGLNRKRVIPYLSHIETCEGDGVNLDQSALEMSVDQSSPDEKTFECAVCKAKVQVLDWNEHIGREHNYLAWRVGATPLDLNDQDAIKEHLLDIIRSGKGLVCYKCGLNRRRVSNYLSHIKTCDGNESHWDQSTSSNLNSTVNSDEIKQTGDGTEKNVKCGVCDQSVLATKWMEHIGREHKYLAWQQGSEPLVLDNEEEVKEHLFKMSRKNNGLMCYQCSIIKKYPKSFQTHVEHCKGVEILDDVNVTNELEASLIDTSHIRTDTVTCGVCKNVVKKREWIKHVEDDHDYMAWLEGRPPLNQKDQEMVQKHLIEVSRITGGLKCKVCGLVRKYAKLYLQHIENCSQGGKIKDVTIMAGKDSVVCAVCSKAVDPKDWRNHAMKKHYNVAWLVGATPIEINNPYGVESYIKEYQQMHNNKLVCKTCGISRVSAVGFYAHIIICGKTEEETEIYKSLCEICNKKYLRIYTSQHMTMHREKVLALERKLLREEVKKEEDEPVEIVGGRRRAAEKAKNVIEKYTSNKGDGTHCSKCGFASDVKSEMLNHVCVAKQYEGSESDESVNTDYSSEEEDDDTDIDSNISDEEREARDQEKTKSKKHRDYSYRIQRLPYQIKNVSSYMRKSAEEFAALHLTNEDLFSQYRNFDYEIVCEADLVNYMPPLEESCKIRYGDDDTWVTCKRFEAKKKKDIITMFTGGCIQNMCWVPSYVGDHNPGPAQEYLSVLTSLAADKPRHIWSEKPAQQPALIQIWDCGNLIFGVPEFVMGLALDCGTVWSIDWCPSGARDLFDPDEECNETRRLGLCAAASANGSVYVFVVPHPTTIKEKGQNFYKLKPVVELRLATDTQRMVYQATAIKWSTQKGHEQLVVGYSNGTTAYFDIKNKSPLLKCTENNVDIVYPYYDERAQVMCIEDVDMFPAGNPRHSPVVVAGSVGGAGTRLHQSHAAVARVLFPPHWPAALLAGDDNLVSQAINELEWYGMGRRVGGLRTVCGCPWCGRIAAASSPLVRLMRTHPAYNDLHRQVIALIQMVSLTNKRKRKANDELSMVMEPLTYNEAILKYGIELKQITAKDKHTQQKLSGTPREAYPERFPLADVTAMAFCPTPRNHQKLAMATHAGVIFIITV